MKYWSLLPLLVFMACTQKVSIEDIPYGMSDEREWVCLAYKYGYVNGFCDAYSKKIDNDVFTEIISNYDLNEQKLLFYFPSFTNRAKRTRNILINKVASKEAVYKYLIRRKK